MPRIKRTSERIKFERNKVIDFINDCVERLENYTGKKGKRYLKLAEKFNDAKIKQQELYKEYFEVLAEEKQREEEEKKRQQELLELQERMDMRNREDTYIKYAKDDVYNSTGEGRFFDILNDLFQNNKIFISTKEGNEGLPLKTGNSVFSGWRTVSEQSGGMLAGREVDSFFGSAYSYIFGKRYKYEPNGANTCPDFDIDIDENGDSHEFELKSHRHGEKVMNGIGRELVDRCLAGDKKAMLTPFGLVSRIDHFHEEDGHSACTVYLAGNIIRFYALCQLIKIKDNKDGTYSIPIKAGKEVYADEDQIYKNGYRSVAESMEFFEKNKDKIKITDEE